MQSRDDNNTPIDPLAHLERAEYKPQEVPKYRGNPLIEALPPIFDEDYVMSQLSNYPDFDEQDRHLSKEARFHLIQELDQYFQPLSAHLDLEQRISRAIRRGYLHRHPFGKETAQRLRESHQAIKRKELLTEYKHRHTVLGFTIMGFSGCGKTSSIERILDMYPQIIRHREYNETPFTFTQISWLKIDTPFDGSPTGLCLSFFYQLDLRLGTNYVDKYGSGRKSIDGMLQRMSHLALVYGIGMLVVDEIQHLNHSKYGGSAKILNFFVTLVNTVGIPVVLIGTNKAAKVLQSEFRQARRGSGQGDFLWEQILKDENWDMMLEGMWDYQWTRNFTPLTPELSDLLYDRSQGILDITVKLFMLSQMRALATGKEQLSKQIINQVASDSLRLVKPMLDALRSGSISRINQYEDLQSIDVTEDIEKYKAMLNARDPYELKKKAMEIKERKGQTELAVEVIKSLRLTDHSMISIEKAVANAIKKVGIRATAAAVHREAFKALEEEAAKASAPKEKQSTTLTQEKKNLLLELITKAHKNKQSMYECLLGWNMIKNPIDENWEEDCHASYLSDSIS